MFSLLRYFIAMILSLCLPFTIQAAEAQAALSPSIIQQAGKPLQQVGSGKYTKLGFTIYRAALWTPSGTWNKAEPYALQLRYARSLSQSTLVEAVVDGIEEQNVPKASLGEWSQLLEQKLPAVKEGDELTGLAVPGKSSQLFFNGKQIATLQDQAFSDAFFGIWFGRKADETLRAQLLGQPLPETTTAPPNRKRR